MGATDKSSAGLTIVIQEHEHTVLNADNSLTRFNPRGKIVVRNDSRKFAVWDAEIELNRPNRTTLGDDPLEIGRLEPLREWEKEFIIKEIESPMLLATEVIDTFYERVGVNNAFVFEYKMPVEISLSLRNHSGAPIKDIVVTKSLPPFFQNIQIQRTEIGKAKYDSKAGEVVWTIKELPPERLAVQRIRTTVYVEDTDPKATGQVRVSYQVPDVVRSSLLPVLHGSTETKVSFDKEEHPMRAGTWRCKASLNNISEFPIRLERVQIVMTGPDSDLLYEGTPDLRLEPEEVWGHEFEVTQEHPEFDIIPLTTVEASLDRKITGTIEKTENVIPVLRIEASKTVEPTELLAWEPAPIAVKLQSKNIGTIECDEVTFIDSIPPGFEPPEETQIRVRVGERPITRSLTVDLRPAKRDAEQPHRLSIRLHDLTEIHAPVRPGDIVTANYIMIARAPKPHQEYKLPLIVEANTFPPGPAATSELLEAAVPTIGVRAVVRKLHKTRTVAPGPTAGELVVTVTFINESETSLHGPELQDLIPPNFEYVGVPPGNQDPSLRETMNGTLVSWSLPTMMSHEKFTAQYIYRPKR